MKVNILRLIEGAKQAEGLTVIIDVFRAFSLECFLFDMGVAGIRPVGSIEEAWKLKEMHPDWLLVGERNGKKCEGFDFGNSPSSVSRELVGGKYIVHTTSAGTQGIVNATGAKKIITGSLVNAKAIAEYIKGEDPEVVSLVCMGNGGIRIANEDELCARYIKSILEGSPLEDLEEQIAALQFDGGEHFFHPETREIFPEPDFWLCIKHDIFDFVIEIEKDSLGYISKVRR